MSTAIVVSEDVAYGPGGHDLTQTPEGRLRVDTGSGTWDNAVAQTAGTTFVPGTGFGFIATAAGTIILTLVSSNTLTYPVVSGWNDIPFTVTSYTLGTATGTGYTLS